MGVNSLTAVTWCVSCLFLIPWTCLFLLHRLDNKGACCLNVKQKCTKMENERWRTWHTGVSAGRFKKTKQHWPDPHTLRTGANSDDIWQTTAGWTVTPIHLYWDYWSLLNTHKCYSDSINHCHRYCVIMCIHQNTTKHQRLFSLCLIRLYLTWRDTVSSDSPDNSHFSSLKTSQTCIDDKRCGRMTLCEANLFYYWKKMCHCEIKRLLKCNISVFECHVYS